MTMSIESKPGLQPVNSHEDDRLVFPLDLGEWVDRHKLLGWIEERINGLDWQNPEMLEYLKRHPDFHPKELLTLLSWAYATGTFESQTIELNCHADPVYRSICAEFPPLARQIIRFRRENRGLLKWIIAETLKEALKENFSLGKTLLPPGLRRFLVTSAIERLDLARHMDNTGHE